MEFGDFKSFDLSYGDATPLNQDEEMIDVQDLERLLMMPPNEEVQWSTPAEWSFGAHSAERDEVSEGEEEVARKPKKAKKEKKEKYAQKRKPINHPERYPGYVEVMQKRRMEYHAKPMFPFEALTDFYTGNGGLLADVVLHYSEKNREASDFDSRAALFKEFDWF